MATRNFALLQKCAEAAAKQRDRMFVAVDLQHVSGDSFEKRTIVAHNHNSSGTRTNLEHKLLKTCQTCKVKVVGGFVETKDVEASKQQRGQSDTGALPSTEFADSGRCRLQRIETYVGKCARNSVFEVGSTKSEPAFKIV